MPTAVGPNTKGEENLVFGYDLGDSYNSFPGIPAVNCAKVPGSGYNWTVTEVTDGSIPPPRKGARVFKFECTNASNLHRQGGYYDGGGFGGSNPTPLILGKTSPSNFTTVGTGKYRFGMWVRGAASNGSATWTIDIGDRNGVSLTVDNNTNWQFISTTDAAGIGSTSYPYDFFDINANIGTYYVADYGIFRSPGTVDSLPALQAYPQWVDFQQERSYTAGLIDLKGNQTIDLSNVSFDSNAQMYFDGTNDIINLGSSLNSYSTPTVEAVFKSNSSSGTNFKVIIGWGATSSGNYSGIHLGSGTSAYDNESLTVWIGGQTLQMAVRKGHGYYHDDLYHHVAVTLSPGANRIYIDGIEQDVSFSYGSVNTNSGGFNQTNNITYIGRRSYSADYYFNGDIPYIKVYNRALTASEIKANFNAIKGRFNI